LKRVLDRHPLFVCVIAVYDLDGELLAHAIDGLCGHVEWTAIGHLRELHVDVDGIAGIREVGGNGHTDDR